MAIRTFSYAALMSGAWRGSSRQQNAWRKACSRIVPGLEGLRPAPPRSASPGLTHGQDRLVPGQCLWVGVLYPTKNDK